MSVSVEERKPGFSRREIETIRSGIASGRITRRDISPDLYRAIMRESIDDTGTSVEVSGIPEETGTMSMWIAGGGTNGQRERLSNPVTEDLVPDGRQVISALVDGMFDRLGKKPTPMSDERRAEIRRLWGMEESVGGAGGSVLNPCIICTHASDTNYCRKCRREFSGLAHSTIQDIIRTGSGVGETSDGYEADGVAQTGPVWVDSSPMPSAPVHQRGESYDKDSKGYNVTHGGTSLTGAIYKRIVNRMGEKKVANVLHQLDRRGLVRNRDDMLDWLMGIATVESYMDVINRDYTEAKGHKAFGTTTHTCSARKCRGAPFKHKSFMGSCPWCHNEPDGISRVDPMKHPKGVRFNPHPGTSRGIKGPGTKDPQAMKWRGLKAKKWDPKTAPDPHRAERNHDLWKRNQTGENVGEKLDVQDRRHALDKHLDGKAVDDTEGRYVKTWIQNTAA